MGLCRFDRDTHQKKIPKTGNTSLVNGGPLTSLQREGSRNASGLQRRRAPKSYANRSFHHIIGMTPFFNYTISCFLE